MATHQYTKSSSALSVGKDLDHTFTTEAFTVPAGERFVRLKVRDPNNSSSAIYLRGDAQTVFGGGGMWDTWASSVSSIWTSGNGCKIKVHNSGNATFAMRIYVDFETEDLPTYNVTCKTSGSGTLTASPTTAYQGRTVTLTPRASTGYTLSKYTSSPSVTITNNKFTMPNSAVTVTATFTNQKYALTVVSEDTDMGTVTGSGTFAYGSSVAITAIPKAGYRFVNWTKTAGTIADDTAASTTFTIPSSAATVTAHFERSQSIVGYYDGEEFKDCNVSVYDGTEWKECDVFRYDGTDWVKCSKA